MESGDSLVWSGGDLHRRAGGEVLGKNCIFGLDGSGGGGALGGGDLNTGEHERRYAKERMEKK